MAKKTAAKKPKGEGPREEGGAGEGEPRRAEEGRAGQEARKATKYVYFFGGGKADGDRTMKDLLGGKGSGLAEMTNAGLPVPPGFTIYDRGLQPLLRAAGGKVPAEVETGDGSRTSRKLEKVAGPEVRLDRRTRCSSPSARARSSRCRA